MNDHHHLLWFQRSSSKTSSSSSSKHPSETQQSKEAMDAKLKRRVRSPDATRDRDPNGFHVNDISFRVRCDDAKGHAKKPKESQSFALRTLCLVILAAAVVMIGREYMERHVHNQEHGKHNLPNAMKQPAKQTVTFNPPPLKVPPLPPPSSSSSDDESKKKNHHDNHHHDHDRHHHHTDKPKIRSETDRKKTKKRKKDTTSTSEDGPTLKFGNMNHALYRFEAKKIGRIFEKAVAYFDEWIGQDGQTAGAAFAKERVKLPGVADYHRQCFEGPDEERMLALEEKKKHHKKKGTKLEFLAEEQQLFYNTTIAGYKQEEIVHLTANSQWAWRTAALFSAQYSGSQGEFRDKINGILEKDKHFPGRVTGTFWYPPNAIREWHTNAWDVSIDKRTGELSKPWRLYFVRQKPVTPGGDVKDKSAFHLVDGNGVTPERLEGYGAYRLTDHEDDTPNVWRVPDQDGYVTLFRLQKEEPYRWHCIVADETVNRYSLGMSLSDVDVEALLNHVDVDL